MTLDIQTLTTTHEGQTFDRKSARIDPKGLAVVLVAMANADGGRVAIGIEDDGTITGIGRYIENVTYRSFCRIKSFKMPVFTGDSCRQGA